MLLFIFSNFSFIGISHSIEYKPNENEINKAITSLFKQKITLEKKTRLTVTPQSIQNYFIPNNCIKPINVELATSSAQKRHNVVKISCQTTNNPWVMYLPVKIVVQTPVIVSRKSIPLGKNITKSDVEIKWKDKNKLTGNEYEIKQDIIGSRAFRRIAKHHPIENSNICHICKNDTVSVEIKHMNLSIKTNAKALSNGVLGEQIELLNLSSKKRLNAIVTGVMQAKIMI